MFWSSDKLEERKSVSATTLLTKRGMKYTLVLRRCEEKIFPSTPHLVLEAMEISVLRFSQRGKKSGSVVSLEVKR